MTTKPAPQGEQTEREAFEARLAANHAPLLWNTSDAMFAAFQWGRASMQAQAPEVAALQREVEDDARRFAWWFAADNPKSANFMNEFLRGVREGWNLDQWRALIDAEVASKAEVPNV